MTQVEAARALIEFYEYVPSRVQAGEFIPKLRTRHNYLTLPTYGTREDFVARRDALIPRSFRFTWPDLPQGAHYVPCPAKGADDKTVPGEGGGK